MKMAVEFFEDISLAANSLRDIDELVEELSKLIGVLEESIKKDFFKKRK